jgi:uncharacterized protein involved in type VI secretion and phage assembly
VTLEHDEQSDRLVALYEGVVVDNRDPLRIGRVRLEIPGLIEPASGWALPIGNPGGGSDAQGFFRPPKIGAEVSVFFVQGNIDQPRYLVGPWGSPGGNSESPTAVRALSPADAVQLAVVQSDRWEIVLDDRPGKESLRIKDLQHDEDVIEIDGVRHGITISGSAAVVIKSVGVVSIDALQILLNGRIVRETGDPI